VKTKLTGSVEIKPFSELLCEGLGESRLKWLISICLPNLACREQRFTILAPRRECSGNFDPKQASVWSRANDVLAEGRLNEEDKRDGGIV
jgi:hypothetical protein